MTIQIPLELRALHDLSFLIPVHSVRVYIDAVREHTKGLQGVYYPDDRSIWVNPDLRGAALYRVVLHEVGHHLGLPHSLVGVMTPTRMVPEDFSRRCPTKAQRQQWCLEVAQQVITLRAQRMWRNAV